jgi:hypothetical protein
MLSKNVFYILIVVCMALVSSCSQRGCKDKDGENYEPTAGTDCSCCFYSAKAIIWYEKPFYDMLKAANVNKLRYYVNGEPGGESRSSIPYYSSSPPTIYSSANNNNGQSYANYYTKEHGEAMIAVLGNDKTKIMNVTVMDQNSIVRWSGKATFKANDVITIKCE